METLESTRLLLRKFNIDDADDCFEFLSDKETCYLDGGYEPWLEKNESFWNLMHVFEKQDSRYMIMLKEKNKVIGTIFLRDNQDRVVKSMEIGYVINPNYRRKGSVKNNLLQSIQNKQKKTDLKISR